MIIVLNHDSAHHQQHVNPMLHQPSSESTADATNPGRQLISSHAVWSNICSTARLPDYDHYEPPRLSDYGGNAELMPSFVDDDDGLIGRLIFEFDDSEVAAPSVDHLLRCIDDIAGLLDDRALSSAMYEADTRPNTATISNLLATARAQETARAAALVIEAQMDLMTLQNAENGNGRSADVDGGGGAGKRIVQTESWFDIVEDDNNDTDAIMELKYQRDERLDRKTAPAEQATEEGAAATMAGMYDDVVFVIVFIIYDSWTDLG